MEELIPWIESKRKAMKCLDDEDRRGLIVIPGGGGKTTLVEKYSSNEMIPLSDEIDQYWDKEENPQMIKDLVEEWNNARKDHSKGRKREEIEDEYVRCKAEYSRKKWSKEEKIRILFVQTVEQAQILLDHRCFLLNLVPCDRLHRSNLLLRGASRPVPIDDYNVCRRQWIHLQEHSNFIFYENFSQLENLFQLFHQFIQKKEK